MVLKLVPVSVIFCVGLFTLRGEISVRVGLCGLLELISLSVNIDVFVSPDTLFFCFEGFSLFFSESDEFVDVFSVEFSLCIDSMSELSLFRVLCPTNPVPVLRLLGTECLPHRVLGSE